MSKNKLTHDILEKSSKELSKTKEGKVELLVDGEKKIFEIDINIVFSPVGITNLISEFVKNMDYAKNVNKEGFGDISEPYLMYLIIKHFTSLGDTMPTKFNEQLVSLKNMMNNTSFFQIIAQVEQSEIEKLKKELDKMLTKIEERVDLVDEMKDEFYGTKIKSKVLMD